MDFEDFLKKLSIDATKLLIEYILFQKNNPNNAFQEFILGLLNQNNIDEESSLLKKLIKGDPETLEILDNLSLDESHELFYIITRIAFMLDMEEVFLSTTNGFIEHMVSRFLEIDNHTLAENLPKIHFKNGTSLFNRSSEEHLLDELEPYFSAIDHVINNTTNSKKFSENRMDDFPFRYDGTESFVDDLDDLKEKMSALDYRAVYTFIKLGIDPKNICAVIDCSEIRPQKPKIPKTTLQFAMDRGLDTLVSLLITEGAHKNIHPWAISTLEYAIILNRPDYIEKLYQLDPDYCNKTIAEPSCLTKHLNLKDFCSSLKDNEQVMAELESFGKEQHHIEDEDNEEERIKEESECEHNNIEEDAAILSESAPSILFGLKIESQNLINDEIENDAKSESNPEDEPEFLYESPKFFIPNKCAIL
jgi:hypothetical protein